MIFSKRRELLLFPLENLKIAIFSIKNQRLERMFRKINMSERRSNLEIVAEILRISKKGVKKTRIVYGANLNFKMLREYLEKLEKAGLIKHLPENGGLIKTTEKGNDYLQQFKGLKEFGID